MSMGMPGAMEMLVVMMFYSGVGLPLGVPPAEQDPLLLKIAPEKCLYYTTWAGMAEPRADAASPTEQLLAEPEVRQLVAHLDTALEAAFTKLADARGADDAAFLTEAGPLWIKSIITRPTAIFVTQFEMQPRGAPQIQAGAIVNTGDDTLKIRDSLLKLQELGADDLEIAEVEIAGATFYQFRPEEDAPLITWGTRGRYLLLGLGEGVVQQMFANARTAPPAWLTALQESLPVERPSTMTYADIAAMINSGLGGLEEDQQEQARKVIAALGLNSAKSYASVTGLDKEGFVNRTVLSIDGESRGIFALADAKPLTAADLAPIPADSTAAFALRLDGEKVLATIQAVARDADPDFADQVDQGLEQVNQTLGLDLKSDILASLGDTWCIYNSAGEGGLLFTGLTATVDLRDRAKAAKAHAQLMALAEAALQPPEDEGDFYYAPPSLKTIEFQGRTIHYLAGIPDVPLAPAWCLTDTHLIVSLYPQNIEALLARGEDYKSLADVPEIASQLSDEQGPLSVTYVDTKALFEMLYPVAQIFATGALNNLAEETGVDIDVGILPRAGTIGKYVRPSVTRIHRSDAGIEFTTRQSLPGASMGSTTPVAVALLLPAVQSAREAARRAQSMNNLRQLGLGILNFESATARFPPQAKKTGDGKPGLSWRVMILPYVEEDALYREFRLDEPWDSEHNKALIARMPPIFRSPASAAGPGMTTYQAVVGDDSIIAKGTEPNRIRDVRDGLYNTMMLVETNDDEAVIWTKPDDYEYDDMDPAAGLQGVWSGRVFLAIFGDCHSRAVSENIDRAALKAFFTKGGGEVVGEAELDRGAFRPDAVDAPADEGALEAEFELEDAPAEEAIP